MRPSNRRTAIAPSRAVRLSVIAVAIDTVDLLCLTVDGELDLTNATWFAGTVTDMMESLPGRRVRIDLASLRFLDAAGIRALLLCSEGAAGHGRTVTLIDPQPIVRRILAVTGLLHMLASPDVGQPAAVFGRP